MGPLFANTASERDGGVNGLRWDKVPTVQDGALSDRSDKENVTTIVFTRAGASCSGRHERRGQDAREGQAHGRKRQVAVSAEIEIWVERLRRRT